jgi:hypothetical protein
MKLNDIAHGRSGDKGDKANVGIRVEDPEDYPFLTSYLTEERMADLFEGLLATPGVGSIDRYELPELGALNFVLHDALGGGASESLRTDPQGKAFAGLVLRQDVTEAYEAFDSDG